MTGGEPAAYTDYVSGQACNMLKNLCRAISIGPETPNIGYRSPPLQFAFFFILGSLAPSRSDIYLDIVPGPRILKIFHTKQLRCYQ